MNYFELKPEDNTFSNVVVDLTHKCNMECANCYIPNRNILDLEVSKLYEFLKKLPFRTYIRLIGAEPTMREDLIDIIKMVKKLGHIPSLTTNGLKLAQLDYVKQLKDAGLRLILHSMNGADDDNAYKVLDNGKWAKVKVKALDNILHFRLPVNTGTIIAKNVNEHIMKRQVDLFAERAGINGINFDNDKPYRKIKPVLRIKSVGNLGRNLGFNHSLSMLELVDLASKSFNLDKNEILNSKATAGVVRAGKFGSAETSFLISVKTSAGNIFVRLVDWSVNDEGVIDHDNPNRGRLTQNWTIAPFFEHVKQNEFGY